MFRKRPHEQSSGLEELRDSLSDRLRLVFDFATLGAYDEQEEHTDLPRDTAAELSAALRRRAEKAQLNGSRSLPAAVPAKHRPVPQPHTQATPSPCDAAAAPAKCSASRPAAVATLARRGAKPVSSRRPRPGAVPAAEQPCTWQE
jgi:hypothetical protein